MHEITEEMKAASDYFIVPRADIPTIIFGRAWTEAEADLFGDSWEQMNYRTNGGYVFGDWASSVYPQGEAGSQHISRCISIDREAYELAQNEKWDVFVVMAAVI